MNSIDLLTNKDAPSFLTDAGLETWLIFHRDIELREFAAFEMLSSATGKAALTEYFSEFLALANRQGKGFLFDTPTWRASPDWCRKLGFTLQDMEDINRSAVAFARSMVRDADMSFPVIVNGIIGPRGDGYIADQIMSTDEACSYHLAQISALHGAGADMVSALTMNNLPEAAGIANAAKEAGIPCVISFTVELDGRLPGGETLSDAIGETDAATTGYPLYYMINCAHPDHFRDAISKGETWTKRIGGLRANASRMSHAELDEAEQLDEGNPQELGELHGELLALLPGIRVLGGCCGTDLRHVTCMAGHLADSRAA